MVRYINRNKKNIYKSYHNYNYKQEYFFIKLRKMNGNTTKYYYYEKSGSGRINIPIALARDLGFEHKDDIQIVIQTINGQKGLFLFKKENK